MKASEAMRELEQRRKAADARYREGLELRALISKSISAAERDMAVIDRSLDALRRDPTDRTLGIDSPAAYSPPPGWPTHSDATEPKTAVASNVPSSPRAAADDLPLTAHDDGGPAF